MKKFLKLEKVILLITCIASLGGIILALLVAFENAPNLRNDVLVSNIFSYFTIQSNLLVCIMSFLLLSRAKFKSYYAKLFLFGTTVNITVTGLVYAVILAGIWEPQGWELISDILLHYVTPLLFFTYWLFFVQNLEINFSMARVWLSYPILYIFYTLLRGLTVDFYPYPFVDASQLSYRQIFINSLGMGVLFIVVGVLLVGLNKLKAKGK